MSFGGSAEAEAAADADADADAEADADADADAEADADADAGADPEADPPDRLGHPASATATAAAPNVFTLTWSIDRIALSSLGSPTHDTNVMPFLDPC